MELLIYLYRFIDTILMPLFRFPDNAVAGYYLGISVLIFASIIVGEYSIALAYRINKKTIKEDNKKINHFQNLSFDALKAGDKAAFKACNSIANETYGKSFFIQITLSAASLWPLFIALGWMQYRFSEVIFNLPLSVPLIGSTVGYVPTFLLCYIAIRLAMRKSRSFIHNKFGDKSKNDFFGAVS